MIWRFVCSIIRTRRQDGKAGSKSDHHPVPRPSPLPATAPDATVPTVIARHSGNSAAIEMRSDDRRSRSDFVDCAVASCDTMSVEGPRANVVTSAEPSAAAEAYAAAGWRGATPRWGRE